MPPEEPPVIRTVEFEAAAGRLMPAIWMRRARLDPSPWRFPLPQRHRFPLDKTRCSRRRGAGWRPADEILEPDPWTGRCSSGSTAALLERIRVAR